MDLISKLKKHVHIISSSNLWIISYIFNTKNNSHFPKNDITIDEYRTHVGFSIHWQEFDEYGVAEDVNDARPRAREFTRGQKAGWNKSGREVRAGSSGHEEKKEQKRKRIAWEGKRVNEQRWRVEPAEEDADEG